MRFCRRSLASTRLKTRLVLERVSAEESLAALAGDGVEVVAEGLVAADGTLL